MFPLLTITRGVYQDRPITPRLPSSSDTPQSHLEKTYLHFDLKTTDKT